MPINAGGGSGNVGGGGNSGGGFSSGGGFNSDGGFHHDYNYGNSADNFPHTSHGRGRRKGFHPVFFIFVLIYIALSFFGAIFDEVDDYDDIDVSYEYVDTDDDYGDEEYEEITIKKEKLSAELCEKTGEYLYNKSELDPIKQPKKLIKAFKNFAEKTGVEPVLYITDEYSDDFSSEAYNLYLDLFDDEGHMLIYFYVDPDGHSFDYDYHYELVVGDEAANSVLDFEAQNTLLNELECLGDNVEEEDDASERDYTDAFCLIMTDCVDEIMTEVEYIPKVTDEADPSTSKAEVTELTSSYGETKDETEIDSSEESLTQSPTDEQPTSNVSESVIVALVAVAVILLLMILIVMISKKHNNTELDEYHSDRTDNDYSLDDYDDQFKKRDKKYDDFLK